LGVLLVGFKGVLLGEVLADVEVFKKLVCLLNGNGRYVDARIRVFEAIVDITGRSTLTSFSVLSFCKSGEIKVEALLLVYI